MSVIDFPRAEEQDDAAKLRLVPASETPVNHDLIASLENLLERAKLGQVRSMAFVTVNDDESYDTGYQPLTVVHQLALLGGLDILYDEFKGAISNE